MLLRVVVDGVAKEPGMTDGGLLHDFGMPHCRPWKAGGDGLKDSMMRVYVGTHLVSLCARAWGLDRANGGHCQAALPWS
jgi:hypothetical protein